MHPIQNLASSGPQIAQLYSKRMPCEVCVHKRKLSTHRFITRGRNKNQNIAQD